MIYPSCSISVIDSPDQIAESGSYAGKPFIRITTGDGTVELTFNQFGMLFGAVKGSAFRLVKEGRLPADNVPPEWLK